MASKENPMREVMIEKVVVNIGVGQAGERLNKAMKVIEMLTNHKPVLTTGKKTVREFNLRKGLTIGTKVTLRGEDASKFLKEAFYANDNKIHSYSIDRQGNAYFGINDYTEFKGMKYDPDIGIFGMDIAIVMKRRGGYRVSRRRLSNQHLKPAQRVTKPETLSFLKNNFNVDEVS